MKKFHVARLFTLCAVLALAACQKQPQTVFVVYPQGFDTFEEEKISVLKNLQCAWTYGASSAHEVQSYDFGCRGGNFASVNLLIDRDNIEPEKIRTIRLIWQENDRRGGRAADRATAKEFVGYLADRFLRRRPQELFDLFFSENSGEIVTGRYHFRYTYTDNIAGPVHRLEISDWSFDDMVTTDSVNVRPFSDYADPEPQQPSRRPPPRY